MKKIISILLAGMFALTMLSGCSTSSKSAVDTIKDKGTIVMYTEAGFPPYEYYKGSDIVGVDVDVAQKIADSLGVKLEVQSVDFGTIVDSVKMGKCDFGAAGMSITDERKKSVDFSHEYATTQQYVILPTSNTTVKHFDDLKNMKIGTQMSTTGDNDISDAVDNGVLKGTGSTDVQYKNALDAALDLKNGKLGAVVIDELTAKNIVATNSGLQAFALVYADGTSTVEKYAIAVSKNNPDLLAAINTVIDQMIAAGTIDQLIVQHTADAAVAVATNTSSPSAISSTTAISSATSSIQ